MKRSKEEVTFFEKKVTKKTFAPLRARWDRTGPAPREAEQKFFARFFSKKRSSSGFTLLEVMAALVIAALATVVLLQAGFAGAAENRAAADYGDALSRAESRLASFGPTPCLARSGRLRSWAFSRGSICATASRTILVTCRESNII